MTKKIGDKKLGSIKQTTMAQGVEGTDNVHRTESVAGIKGVAATSGVGGVKGAGAIGSKRATRTMTIEEREQILNTITEEANKMFSSGVMPASKKDVITQAVKMAVDAGLIEKESDKK